MSTWWRRFLAAMIHGLRSRGDGGRGAGGTAGPDRAPSDDDAGFAPRPRAGDDVARLIAALKHPNPDVRASAAHALGGFVADNVAGPGVVTALIKALQDPDPSVGSSAALSLGEGGSGAEAAIPALIDALASEDDDFRSSAGLALQDIGPASRPALEAALSHPNPLVRTEAAALLRVEPPHVAEDGP